MKPEFLFFDLGNVLLTFCHDRMCRQMAEAAGVEPGVIERAILPGGDTEDPQWKLEEGQLSEEAYYELICQAAGSRPDRARLEEAASDIFEPIEASLELMDRLAAAGNRLGILSNTNAIHWRWFFGGRYPVLERAFDLPLASFQLKSMKPAPEIYHAAVEKTGVAAERVFFADDKPENVAGAVACGLDAVLFTTTGQLASDLRERGVDF